MCGDKESGRHHENASLPCCPLLVTCCTDGMASVCSGHRGEVFDVALASFYANSSLCVGNHVNFLMLADNIGCSSMPASIGF